MKFTFAPESRPLPGFTIKRAIYRGGFGEVYYAVSDAGREVALKLLQHNTEVELRGVQQCLNLSHPNLVTIFDILKDDDGDHWIVMEYVSGLTLDQTLRNHPKGLPIEQVRQWLQGIAAGIDFLHQRGLVHRDLKPANVFLQSGTVKIGDVGLSKFISASQRSAQTQSVGTVYYMAPEVAKGSYGREVDVYALGIMLYEMLTGDVPFEGESTGEILLKHLTAQPDLSKLPTQLRPVIGKALNKDPRQRYSSAGALAQAFLEAAPGGTPPPPRNHGGTAESFSSDSRRNGAPETHRKKKYCGGHWNHHWKGCGTYSKHRVHKADSKQTWSGVRACSPGIDSNLSRHVVLIGLGALIIVLSILGAAGPHLPFSHLVPPHRMSRGIFLGALFVITGLLAWKRIDLFRPIWPRPDSPAIGATVATPMATSSMETLGIKNEPTTEIQKRNLLARALAMASLAAPVGLLLSLLLSIIRPSLFTVPKSAEVQPTHIGLFVSGVIIACWGVAFIRWLQSQSPKAPVSFWAKSLVGVVVGVQIAYVHQFLFVQMRMFESNKALGAVREFFGHELITQAQGPTLTGYALFFGSLFAFINWAKLTSPRREQRFSFWRTASVLFATWLILLVFAFPVAWGLAWAAVIACTVQLTDPWIGPSERVGTLVRPEWSH